jgi:phosphoribosylamine--glycine ligase
MEQEGMRFTGFLYAGLMIDSHGNPRVIEFNCRMGDPETQVIMARLKGDFSKAIEAALAGTLDQAELEWDRRTALGVVLAAHGYPQAPRTGDVIDGITNSTPAQNDEAIVFHAGTALAGDQLVTHGGRVLCAVGLADSFRSARAIAYETVNQIHFAGMQYRHDIGHHALARKVLPQGPATAGGTP